MDIKKYKFILDTDIGDDIDDAFALGISLINDVNLVGVTTTFKNTIARARQASELISLAGKDVPVYAGETYPLNGKIVGFEMDKGNLATIKPCQYDEDMEKYPYNSNIKAPQAIVDLCKKYSKEIIIITIGPITNVARALEIDPSIKDDIYCIYQMGGCFSRSQPEWNILCDVEGVEKVYNSSIPIFATGLDITMQCPLDGSLLTNLSTSNKPITKKIFTWFDRWMNYFHFEKSVLHDPLVVSSLIDKNIITYEKRYVKVIKEGDNRSAFDISIEPKDGYSLINAAVSVNKDIFFKLVEESFK